MFLFSTHLQVLSNLAHSGASRFRVKVLSEAFHLLSDVGLREECGPKALGPSGGSQSHGSQACPGHGRDPQGGAGAASTTSSPLKGLNDSLK